MEVVHMWLDYEGPEWTSKLPEEVAQIPMVSTPITMPSLKHTPVASRSVPYDLLTKEVFWVGPGLLMILHTMQASPRTEKLQHGSSFWAHSERHKWRVIFTVGRKNFRWYTWPYICLQWEMARYKIVHWFLGWTILMDCLDSQTLGKSDWEIGEKDIVGGSKCGWIYLNGWRVGRYCVSCKCSSKGTSAEEEVSSWVDRITSSVDSQPLPPAIPVIQNGQGDRNGGYTWIQLHRLPLTKADLATSAAECQILIYSHF